MSTPLVLLIQNTGAIYMYIPMFAHCTRVLLTSLHLSIGRITVPWVCASVYGPCNVTVAPGYRPLELPLAVLAATLQQTDSPGPLSLVTDYYTTGSA